MFCKYCGQELQEGASFCASCGNKVEHIHYNCPNCGYEADASTQICPSCGYEIPPRVEKKIHKKSKLIAGLLGIIVGSFGVHNFYLGYSSKGFIQLVMTLCGIFTCGISSLIAEIWGIIEGIMILTGSIDRDVDGNLLDD